MAHRICQDFREGKGKRLIRSPVEKYIKRRLCNKSAAIRTPAGTSTPFILTDEEPTTRGAGLTTPPNIRSDSLMTAV